MILTKSKKSPLKEFARESGKCRVLSFWCDLHSVALMPLFSGQVRQYWESTGPDDDVLIFESRFESGNLRRAIQIYRECQSPSFFLGFLLLLMSRTLFESEFRSWNAFD